MEDERKTKKQLIAELQALRLEQREQTRISSEKFTKAFLQNSIPAVITTAKDGRFFEVSDAFLQLVELKRDEVVGYTSREIGFLTEEQTYSFFNELGKYGRVANLEMEVRTQGKGLRYGLFNAVMISINNENYLLTTIHDITERKQAEEALRESEQKLQSIINAIPDGLAISTIEGNLQYVSPNTISMFGYPSMDELKGRNILEFVHPSYQTKAISLIGEMLNGNYTGAAEYLMLKKDGTEFFCEINAEIIRNADGEPTGIAYIKRDITERKNTDDALRESEERYRKTFMTSPDAIFITRFPDGMFVSVNAGFTAMTGYTDEEIIGKLPLEINIWKDHEERNKIIEEFLTKGEVRNFEACFLTKHGEIVALISVSRVELKGVPHNLCIARDITERKRVEEALQDSEERYRTILNSLQESYHEVDLNGRYTFLNDSALQIVGFSAEEMMDMNFNTLFEGETREKIIKSYKQVFKTGEPIKAMEFELITKNGRIVPMEASVSLKRNATGDPVGFRVVTRDITARKQAEEEKRILEDRLQHADKMDAIGTLAGGVAHDFNNLLMGIQGNASLSLMDIDPTHPTYENLKRIEEQVQSGAALTKQLLGFARGGKYEVKPTDMNEVIEKISSLFGRTKKEISIQRKHGKDLWSVEVDRGQMEQVFLNLYVNAWQAMPGGGDIYLETQNILLDEAIAISCSAKPGKYVKITVTDSGTGMDEKTKARIFEPFFTTKRMGRGTGLGLATVYGIIKGHHGIINVYSEPGHGTTFTVYLPASEKEVVKEKTATGKIIRGKETILLVDDEKMVMEVSKELLESLGYKVYVAGSGQEAIAVYMEKGNKIDLVILDMIMPGISGGGTFDRLMEINPQIKILLSSGYSLNGQAQEILDRGCKGFLQKPFHLSQFSGKIREILD